MVLVFFISKRDEPTVHVNCILYFDLKIKAQFKLKRHCWCNFKVPHVKLEKIAHRIWSFYVLIITSFNEDCRGVWKHLCREGGIFCARQKKLVPTLGNIVALLKTPYLNKYWHIFNYRVSHIKLDRVNGSKIRFKSEN